MSEEELECTAIESYSLPYIRENRMVIFSLIDTFPTDLKVSVGAMRSKV